MDELNLNNAVGSQNSSKKAISEGKVDRILSLIHNGIQDVDKLAATFKSVNSALCERKNTEIETTVKLSNAKNEEKKEEYRHSEAMAKIDKEWEKLFAKSADRDSRLKFVKDIIQQLQDEYDKYMKMETKDFLDDKVATRLKDLRSVIMELAKELIKIN